MVNSSKDGSSSMEQGDKESLRVSREKVTGQEGSNE